MKTLNERVNESFDSIEDTIDEGKMNKGFKAKDFEKGVNIVYLDPSNTKQTGEVKSISDNFVVIGDKRNPKMDTYVTFDQVVDIKY